MTRPGPRRPTALDGFVALASLLGQAAFLLAAAHEAARDTGTLPGAGAHQALVRWLVLAPLAAGPWLTPRLARRGAALLGALAGALLFAVPPAARVDAIGALGLGVLGSRRHHDVTAALALACAPLGAFAALATAPSGWATALLVATLALGLAGGVHVHTRATARRARSADLGVRAARLGIGGRLAAATLAASVPLLAGIDAARGAWTQVSDVDDAADSLQRPEDAAPEGGDRGRGDRGAEGPANAFEDSLVFGGRDPASLLSDAEVLRVTGPTPANEGEVVYLRNLVLDTFTTDGVTTADRRAPRERRDGDDGKRDGWVELRAPTPDATPTRYDIEARPLLLGEREWTILPLPEPALRVTIEPVRYSPDGPSVLGEARRDWFRYACEAAAVRLTRAELAARDAGPARRRDLALPADGDELRSLAQLARRLTRGQDSDLGRVMAVVTYLRGFEYGLEDTRFAGVAGLAEFVARGRGYCTHFASTAALLLRLVDVPARVAVGYLADEVVDGRWVARERDAHAWVEVPFEGLGWLAFDPTPYEERGGGAARGWSPLLDEPASAPRDTTTVGRFLWEAREAYARFVAGDMDLVAAVARVAGAVPAGLLLGLVALVGAVLGLLVGARRRWSAARDLGGPLRGAGPARPSQPSDLHAELERTLASRGLARPPARTLAQHVATMAWDVSSAQVLPELVRAAYRERFGPGLDPTQGARAQALMALLRHGAVNGNTSGTEPSSASVSLG